MIPQFFKPVTFRKMNAISQKNAIHSNEIPINKRYKAEKDKLQGKTVHLFFLRYAILL